MRKNANEDYWTSPRQLAPSISEVPAQDDEMAPRRETPQDVVGCDRESVTDPLEILSGNIRNAPRRRRTEEEGRRLNPLSRRTAEARLAQLALRTD